MEGIYRFFVNLGLGAITFALDCPIMVIIGLRNEVDARVVQRNALAEGKLTPQPHLLQLVAIGRNGAKHSLHKAFESFAFVGFGVRLIAVAVYYFFKMTHDAWMY